jgi:hypothetical protein
MLAATVITAEPDFVSLDATIVAVPAEIPCTIPVGLTVAVAGSELDHVTSRPVSVFPPASVVVAVSCCVVPMSKLAVGGETVTVATGAAGGGAVTVSGVDPVLPPALAMICVVPGESAVTTPALLTVATVGALDDQLTVPVAIAAPF